MSLVIIIPSLLFSPTYTLLFFDCLHALCFSCPHWQVLWRYIPDSNFTMFSLYKNVRENITKLTCEQVTFDFSRSMDETNKWICNDHLLGCYSRHMFLCVDHAVYDLFLFRFLNSSFHYGDWLSLYLAWLFGFAALFLSFLELSFALSLGVCKFLVSLPLTRSILNNKLVSLRETFDAILHWYTFYRAIRGFDHFSMRSLKWNIHYLFIRTLFFLPRLNFLIFLQILVLKCSYEHS